MKLEFRWPVQFMQTEYELSKPTGVFELSL